MTSQEQMAPVRDRSQYQTVVAVVQNATGVLARVVGLFARRGFNIYSLAVAPLADDRFSRITFVYDTRSAPVEQVVSQVGKLINVISIEAIDFEHSIGRELMLATVSASAEGRPQVVDLTKEFEAKIVDVGGDSMTVMLAGRTGKIDDFEEALKPFGIKEMQRSGKIALPQPAR